ncbi:MAG: transposase [Ignavibacteria bacterium]|nr:transposase [Ignavibacteria bacterium]
MAEFKHRRKAIRLRGYDYSQPGEYFVTICTKDREHILGKIEAGRMLLNGFGEIVALCWMDLPNHYPGVQADQFVVMPNHVHGIIVITERNLVGEGSEPSPTTRRHPLSEIVRSFKTFSARRINECRGTPGLSVWQRNYYEHIIRDERSLERIRVYIVSNPERWVADENNLEQGAMDEFSSWINQEGMKSPRFSSSTSRQ